MHATIRWSFALLMIISTGTFAQQAQMSQSNAADANLTDTERERIGNELDGQQLDLFRQLDTNGDGRISQQEAQKNAPLAQAFSDLDHDDDNHLRAEEISDWQAMETIDQAQ